MADLTCVGAILVNPAGRILLQQRENKPGLMYPGCWTTFGGTVEPGETPDEAMRRELLEEIELEPAMRLWKVWDNPIASTGVVVEQYVYVGSIDLEADDITLNEGQALAFFGPDDLDTLPIAFGFGRVFREFFAEQENS